MNHPQAVLHTEAVGTSKRKIAYWICTTLIAMSFFTGGLSGLLGLGEASSGILALGYPLHFIWLLGFWKMLGAVTVVLPRLALPKEWAYAGMMIDLTGASFAHLVCGSSVRHVVVPLVIAGLVAASWALRPSDRKLPPG